MSPSRHHRCAKAAAHLADPLQLPGDDQKDKWSPTTPGKPQSPSTKHLHPYQNVMAMNVNYEDSVRISNMYVFYML